MKKIFAVIVALFVGFAGFHIAEPAHAATSKTKYVTASTLNVRTGAGTKYKVVTTIKKNQSVKVTQTKGSWDKVTVGGKIGWASNTYLTTKKPATPKNLAAGLKTVGSNMQLILVTSNGYNTSSAEIRTFEKNSKGQWNPVLTIKGHSCFKYCC
ncbi:SH3 domain-containing protein [Heyndrickxia sporothermodurans]|uniref:SH3 domain-containing protein n=1 Tax=Heyndrickxia sporothermodurans TaxID=46224 RepID=UPI002DB942F3|nr:SH3 domain-containing protein [Heyndrickxia sporothermodurans]